MNPQLENGYTKLANEILEKLSQTYLSPYEWQVLMAIFRKTYGYNKKEDWISNSQLFELTGIAKPNITRTLRKLENRKIIIYSDNKIAFNKNHIEWEEKKLSKQITKKKLSKQITELSKQITPVIQTDNNLLSIQIPTKEKKENITKETITKENKKINKKRLPKETELSQLDFEDIAEKYQVPISFVLSKWEDVINYCYSNNKKYSDFKRTLSAWVKKDALKIRKDHNERQQSKSSIAYYKD